ncbi:hypothetical protein, conserved [Eimeria praecox]|uniref:Uncharacterized protein n=1 Tax=Eimeria praecox TaxID=51316 RepID=U6H2P9_9EIME|nr:hypothetical protein, conserved [Eimeria praecox]
MTKTTLKEQAATSRAGTTRLPSAPSTASTTAAETTTKVTNAPYGEPSRGKMRASVALLASERTQRNPAQGGSGTTTGRPFQAESEPPPLSGPYKCTNLGVPVASAGPSVSDKQCSAVQQQTHSNEDIPTPQGSVPLMPSIRGSDEGRTEGTRCKGIPYDSSVACLVAALGASSLRLAAAAEEGLDSSPSDAGSKIWKRSEISPLRTPGKAATELLQTAPPSIPSTNSLSFAQARSSPATRRLLTAPKAPELTRKTRKISPSLDVSRSNWPQESPLQTPQKSPSKETPRGRRRSDTICQKNIANHRHELDPILLDLCADGSSNSQTVSMLPHEREMLPYRSTCSPAAEGSTPSSSSDSKKPTRGTRTTPSKEAAVFPTSITDSLSWDNLRSSPEWPVRAHAPHRVEALRRDSASNAYHGEEEHQFSLVLQHSLALLRREASRCFASSQASVKQELWRELQQERSLRLQLQQEHQVGSAAAEAELVSLRAQQVEDHERLEKVVGICCRRKHTDEGSQLMRFAWKGWQVQRVLTGRLKKLQQALQKRHAFMLQLRHFLPWRAAAARRILKQQMQRAQILFHQEMQRLGQAHLENTQRQQQELRKLQQQLDHEKHLRECLQQSLIGLFSGGGIGAPSEGAHVPTPRDTISFAPIQMPGALSAKRQHRQKAQENPTRRQKALRVTGTQSSLRNRRTMPNQNNSRQHEDEKQQQCDYGAKQPWWQWVLQNAGVGKTATLQPNLYKLDPRAANGFAAGAARRVKFTDEQAQQQQQNQQEKLLLLAKLLSEPFPQLQNYSGAVVGGSSSGQVCGQQHCSYPGLASASTPTFCSWELIPDIYPFKKNAASASRYPLDSSALVHQACIKPNATIGDKRNHSANPSWNPSPISSFGLECHQHKQTRWTSAGQSTSAE